MPTLRELLTDFLNRLPDEEVGPTEADASTQAEATAIAPPAISQPEESAVLVGIDAPNAANQAEGPDINALNEQIEALQKQVSELSAQRARRAPMPTADTEPDIERMTIDERATYYRDTVLPGLLKEAELARR